MNDHDWKGRAEREAAAIVAQALPNQPIADYSFVVSLVAIGWLQGAIYGTHDSLRMTEDAFDQLKAAL